MLFDEESKNGSAKRSPSISIIVSTYNNYPALRLVLLALSDQDENNFEVIIADDGSDNSTLDLISQVKTKVKYSLTHVWHSHENFRAAIIRNKAAAAASGDYLIFLDGDSIPMRSFVKRHRLLAENSYFVAGNRVLLSSNFTKKVTAESQLLQNFTFWHWFYSFLKREANRFLPVIKIGRQKSRWRYYSRYRWQGAKSCNLAIWRKDFLLINGFDESYYGWGYEDSDLVIRLIRAGILRKDGRFALPVFHLWHPENSRNRADINYHKLKITLSSKEIRAQLGVDQYDQHAKQPRE